MASEWKVYRALEREADGLEPREFSGAHQARLVSFPCFDRDIGPAEPRPPADITYLDGGDTLE